MFKKKKKKRKFGYTNRSKRCVFTEERPHEDTVGSWPAASQIERPQKKETY